MSKAIIFRPQECGLNREMVSLQWSESIEQVLLGHNQASGLYKEVVSGYPPTPGFPAAIIRQRNKWRQHFLQVLFLAQSVEREKAWDSRLASGCRWSLMQVSM